MSINRVLTGYEMAEIDKISVKRGIKTLDLMEKAGQKVANIAKKELEDLGKKNVLVICGKGNNGGDGFVTSSILYKSGFNVLNYYIDDPLKLKEPSKTSFDKAKLTGLTLKKVEEDLIQFKEDLQNCDFVIDAIFGTGLKRPVKGIYLEIINLINNANKYVLSIDIPSGVNGDSGEVLNTAVKANITVTLQTYKFGLLNYPGASYVGDIKCVDIGIPQDLIEKCCKIYFVDDEWVLKRLPKRKAYAHKGDAGKLFVIAGSPGFTGAAYMCSMSALMGGAGVVTLVIPEGLNAVMETKLTEVMTLPLPQTKDGTLAISALPKILNEVKKFDCLAIGPGISLNEETSDLVISLVKNLKIPLVIDADAITILSKNLEVLRDSKSPIVITPHPGELSRLLHIDKVRLKDRLELNREISKKIKKISVLKGARTLISNPEGETFVNLTGSPAMATAGSGDVLVGLIGSLIVQGVDPYDAAIMGTYLHGLAGDMAVKEVGQRSLIATDIMNKIPDTFLRIEGAFPFTE
jgi:NAD(P)H-hydrate epimerase